jgi:hypothetical protein
VVDGLRQASDEKCHRLGIHDACLRVEINSRHERQDVSLSYDSFVYGPLRKSFETCSTQIRGNG